MQTSHPCPYLINPTYNSCQVNENNLFSESQIFTQCYMEIKQSLELPLMVLNSRQNTWRVCINYRID